MSCWGRCESKGWSRWAASEIPFWWIDILIIHGWAGSSPNMGSSCFWAPVCLSCVTNFIHEHCAAGGNVPVLTEMGLCRCRKWLCREARSGGDAYNWQEAGMWVWEPRATFVSPPAFSIMWKLCFRLPNSQGPRDSCWVSWTVCCKRLVWLQVRVVAACGSAGYTNPFLRTRTEFLL